jgi:hypothetical protein
MGRRPIDVLGMKPEGGQEQEVEDWGASQTLSVFFEQKRRRLVGGVAEETKPPVFQQSFGSICGGSLQ